MYREIDVDECVVNNGGCSPVANCTNTPGSFTCTCIEGYNGDGFSCSGNTTSADFFFFVCLQY